jgi:hypothetical protein
LVLSVIYHDLLDYLFSFVDFSFTLASTVEMFASIESATKPGYHCCGSWKFTASIFPEIAVNSGQSSGFK